MNISFLQNKMLLFYNGLQMKWRKLLTLVTLKSIFIPVNFHI